jgi:hypothetical protein
MLIAVRYNDDSEGRVDDSRLTALIATDSIRAFRRSSGWVIVGRDRVREQTAERRRKGCLINEYV